MIKLIEYLTDNRIRVAKFVFSLDAVLGILTVGSSALYNAALTSGNVWAAFFSILVPFGGLWTLFCYLAYKGLTSEKAVLKCVFWSYVVWNIFVFPVGTAIAGVSIWLWRGARKQNILPASA